MLNHLIKNFNSNKIYKLIYHLKKGDFLFIKKKNQ